MSEPYYQDDTVTLYHGDCLEVLRELPDCSVDSVTTEGFRCIGIEREADYLPLITQRLSKPIAPVLDLGGIA